LPIAGCRLPIRKPKIENRKSKIESIASRGLAPEFVILGSNLGCHASAEVKELLFQGRVFHSQDLNRQQAGVPSAGATNGHAGYGDTAWHLHR
jgi:hypothetical protein